MSRPRVETFLFDEENEEKILSHGLSIDQVVQVLTHLKVILPNRKRRRGLFLLIGRDNGGNCISLPIEKTYVNGVWRPITAWLSKKGEETILRKNERQYGKEK